MNVDELFHELENRGVSRSKYLLFRNDGDAYGRGDVTQLVLKPIGGQWEVGTKDQASYFPEARFESEDEACRFALTELTSKAPPVPVHHLTPEEEARSRRMGKQQTDQYLKKLRERGFKT